MLEFDVNVIMAWLAAIGWPSIRMGAFFMVAPVIGTQLVPMRIRVIFTLVTTAIVAPHLPPMPDVALISLDMVLLTAQQILIGVGMAVIMQVLLQMFVVGGQIIAMKMGLGFASMVDPSNGVSVTVVSQFHLMMATLLFLSMNGHLAMIDVLIESFRVLPVGGGFVSSNGLWQIVSWGSWMFAMALLMALPAVVSLLIINFAVAVVTRAAPQLNIFSIGFPFMLVLGLVIVWASIGGYVPHFDNTTRQALDFMSTVLMKP